MSQTKPLTVVQRLDAASVLMPKHQADVNDFSIDAIADEKRVETALLQTSLVEDCAVVIRVTDAKRELIAYVVSSEPLASNQLQSSLETLLPPNLLPTAYVPISAIPLLPSGAVDQQALSGLPILDADVTQQWEHQLRSLPEVAQAAVVIQDYTTPETPLHLSDVLPNWRTAQTTTDNNSTDAHQHSTRKEPRSEAIAFTQGEPLHDDPNAPNTLQDVLKQTALNEQTNGILYVHPDGSQTAQSYLNLLEESERILGGLRASGLTPNDSVILQLELKQDIIPAFWGCILGGFTPVIVAVPPTYSESNSDVDKLCHVWNLLDRPLIITSESLATSVRSLSQRLSVNAVSVQTIEGLRTCERDRHHHTSQPDDIAFFNLTSGSTGVPKCIMLTHRNIISRARGASQLCQHSREDVNLSWLPFDHIGTISDWHIRCVYLGGQLIYISKEQILGHPLNWLTLIDQYRISHTWAPNFAYALVNDALKHAPTASWDLSCVKSLLTAGEAVSPQVIEDFLKNLAVYGLKKTAIQPAFGMAEMGSGVSYFQPTETEHLTFHTVDRASLTGAVAEVGPDHPNSITFTNLGPAIPGVAFRIVDANNNLLPEYTVGHLHVKGEAVFPGYYKAPDINRDVLGEDGWFNTGDLGFLSEGRLVLTGRAKEVIIINGANYYSDEIETVAEEIAGVTVSYTAACAVRSVGSTSEKLAIFFNPAGLTYDGEDDDRLLDLLRKIQEHVVRKVRIKPDYLIPVAKETIPKTAIGKLQRSQLSRRFEAGEFDAIVKRVDLLTANANTLPNWFYRKIWRPQVSLTTRPLAGQYLVFLDTSGFGLALRAALEQVGASCVVVETGTDFTQLSPGHYCIDPKQPEHYCQLLKTLQADTVFPDRILHLWTYDNNPSRILDPEAIERSQERGIYSLLHLVQALAQLKPEHVQAEPLQLYVIASNTQATTATEPIACEKASILGLVKTIPQELPWLHCCHVDLPGASRQPSTETTVDWVLQELRTVRRDLEVAYRPDRGRLISRLERVDFQSSHQQDLPIQTGGLYLVTGGLGGIGVEIASYLLTHHQARLVLVGKTPLPPREEWGTHLNQATALSHRINAYLALEKLGEIVYEAVDVCDGSKVQQVVERATVHWQRPLQGVIHLAGIVQDRLLVDESQASLAATLHPKVLGTWSLYQLLNNNRDSIFVSFSSVSTFFGGTTTSAYAAANSFVESFSYAHQGIAEEEGRSPKTYCFAWSMWDEVGMSRGYQMKELSRARGYHTITAKQGLHSFLIGLSHQQQAPLFIGLDGRNRRIRHRVEADPYPVQTLAAYVTARSGQPTLAQTKELVVRDRTQIQTHCSVEVLPDMPLTDTGEIDYAQLTSSQRTAKRVAPRDDLERQMAKIWQELLNVPDVSIHDNFFELGGSSLLAVQLFSKIETEFGKNLPLATLFQATTVEELTNVLREKQDNAPSWSPLVAIQPNGTKPPLFCPHAAGGNVIIYRSLVPYLGPDQPVYGLQPKGLNGKDSPLTRFEDIADYYIDAIRKHQPEGPYHLAGLSSGGGLAVAIAQRLQSQGQQVGFVGLFDSYARGYPKMLPATSLPRYLFNRLLQVVDNQVNTLRLIEPDQRWAFIKEKISIIPQEVQKLLRQYYWWTKQPLPKALKKVQKANKKAVKSYVPKVYAGKVTVFRAEKQPVGCIPDPELGWGRYVAGGIEIHTVPGYHANVIREPFVKVLGQKLKTCLETAYRLQETTDP